MFFILDHERKSEVISTFHMAVLRRNYDFIEYLGHLGINMNAQTSKGNTGLHFAAKLGDLQMIKLLAAFNVYLNISNQDDKTPLYFALQEGRIEIVKWFISIHPNLQYDFQKEDTLCHIASTYNQKKIIKWLNRQGLDIDKANSDGETPLHYAVKSGCIEAVSTLVSLKVRLNHSNIHGQAPIHQAAEKDLNILKILWAKGADIYLKDRYGANIVHAAAKYGKLDVIKWVDQELGLKMELLDNDEDSPIHYAAKNGNVEVLEYFYNKGLPVNIPNINGETPLFLAASENHLNVIKYLHQRIGVDITRPDKDGDYLIHIAAIEGNVDLINWLITKSIDIKVKDSEEQTPLELAIFHKNWHSARILKHHLMKQNKLELGTIVNTSGIHEDQALSQFVTTDCNTEKDWEKPFLANHSQVEDIVISGEMIENYNTLNEIL